MARSIGDSVARAEHLLQTHREIFRTFWRWSEAAVNHCLLHGFLHTRFGWRVHLDHDPNPRSLANYPSQANGAEMMRLAAILLTRRGIPVCCPVHDAFLVEGPVDEIDDLVAETVASMEEASRLVLDGFTVNVDAKVIRWPKRYMDKRGRATWNQVVAWMRQRAESDTVTLG